MEIVKNTLLFAVQPASKGGKEKELVCDGPERVSEVWLWSHVMRRPGFCTLRVQIDNRSRHDFNILNEVCSCAWSPELGALDRIA